MVDEKLNIGDISVDKDQNGNDALYDQKGNFMGWGGPGKVTVSGVDPTDGGQQELVKAGFDSTVNGVSEKKVKLPGWNGGVKSAVESSNGGQSVDGGQGSASVNATVTNPSALSALRSEQRKKLENEDKANMEKAIAHENADAPIPTTGEFTGVNEPTASTPVVTSGQLDKEQNANPESGNNGSVVAGTDGGQQKGGQSKEVSGAETPVDGISESDYNAAKKRTVEAQANGGVPSKEDWMTVWKYENSDKRPDPLSEPKLPKLVSAGDPPELKSVDDSYRDAYAKYLEKMKEAELDPESKAKRYKARRARRIIAALGDLLQAAANMWGAYKGADSAKLTSQSKAAREADAKEDALDMKKAAQLAKEMENDIRRGTSMTREQNEKLKMLWNAKLSQTRDENRLSTHAYDKMMDQWKEKEKTWESGLKEAEKEWYKEYNASKSREHQKAMENLRTAGRLAVKNAVSHSYVHHDGGGGKKKGSGTPV